jgi:hypothetical protein
MGLVHSLSGGRLAAFEQGLDLSLRARETGVEGLRLPSLLSSEDRELVFAGEGGFVHRNPLRVDEPPAFDGDGGRRQGPRFDRRR